MKQDSEIVKFWYWFFKGSGGKSGIRRIFDRWIFFHLALGTGLGFTIQIELSTAASTVLLPLVGILIGLAFAWAGNAQALMQSEEIEKLSQYHKGGYVDYAYTYQLSILIILVTISSWALAGLQAFDKLWPTQNSAYLYFFVKLVLYGLGSLTIRECWQIVLAAQMMLLAQRNIRKHRKGLSEGKRE